MRYDMLLHYISPSWSIKIMYILNFSRYDPMTESCYEREKHFNSAQPTPYVNVYILFRSV